MDEMDTSSPMWVNLRLLSKLRKGDKINMSGDFFFIERSDHSVLAWVGWVMRQFSVDSRDTTLARIEGLFTQAWRYHRALGRRPESAARLCAHVRNSIRGLFRLQETYADDQTCVARIEALVESMEPMVGEVSDCPAAGDADESSDDDSS